MPMALYESCFDACIRCAKECEHCATTCLGEPGVEARAKCIRYQRDCAQMCWTTATCISRSSFFLDELCALCAKFCDLCVAEFAKHDKDHCQRCAEACRVCAAECRALAKKTL